MKPARDVMGWMVIGLVLSAGIAHADPAARLISVSAASGACVAGPTGRSVQSWDLGPGRTYDVIISGVMDRGNHGTAATIHVRVDNSGAGNTDHIAARLSPGTYVFLYTMPPAFSCSGSISYGTTPGVPNSGVRVLRSDGGPYPAHLRAATFAPSCTIATLISGPACGLVGTRAFTWAGVKTFYR